MSALARADFPARHDLQRALRDLAGGARSYHIWGRLGWQDIRQRYRRSLLGPFWITISAAAMIGGIGMLYSRLLHQETEEYIPFLSVGLLIWTFIATLINEGCTTFTGADQFIKQVKLPLTVHVWRAVWRNVIILGHNLLILVPVFIFYHRSVDASALLSLLGIVLLAFNGVTLGIGLGLLCARFRDVPPIIGSLVQLAFFVTPVMFPTKALGQHEWIAQLNPFFHFLQIVRAPLIGTKIEPESWVFAILASLFMALASLALFVRFRARIPYWV